MTTTAYEPALHALLGTEFRGERGPTIAPTLYLALYIDPVRPADVLDFIERSRQALGARLRFYQTGTMKEPAPLGETKIAQWLEKKLRPTRRVEIPTLIVNELGDDGVTPSQIRVNVNSQRVEPLDDSQRRRDEERRFAQLYGGTPMTAGALLVAGFPLDHPISEPNAFIPWVQGLSAVTSGRLVCGSAGIALSLALQVFGDDAVEQHELAKGLLARHPGLDLIPMFGQRVAYMTAAGDVHPRVRRAAWLNLLSDATIEELGGIARLEAALAGTSARVHRLDESAWLVQAGPAPRIGDVAPGDTVSEYRAVGRLLKPVRGQETSIDVLSYSLEWIERWSSALDGDERT